MLTVYVAIGALSLPVESCNRTPALDWMAAPQRQASPIGCIIHSQRYAAQSRLVAQGTYPKIFCRGAGGMSNVASQ